MYYIADGSTIFEVTLDRGALTRPRIAPVSGVTGDVPKLPETGFAYDPVARVIGGGIVDGVFHAYDPSTKRWTRRVMRAEPADRRIGTLAFHAIDYDPVDNVFVFITDYDSGRRTWAYRHVGRPSADPAAGTGSPRKE
jgi:hypothetical protein